MFFEVSVTVWQGGGHSICCRYGSRLNVLVVPRILPQRDTAAAADDNDGDGDDDVVVKCARFR